MKISDLRWAQLRPGPHNRRLWILLVCGVLAIGFELATRAWEHQAKLDQQLTSLRKRIQLLHASADRVDWPRLSDELAAAQQSLQSQLWHAPSEAQAQAMLRDWLSTNLRAVGIAQPTLRLQPIQAGAPAASASAPGDDAAASSSGRGAELARKAVRTRAQIAFQLEPGTLENVLERIEQGGQLASVDALTVSKRSRRVEMTVSVPVIIEGTRVASTGKEARP